MIGAWSVDEYSGIQGMPINVIYLDSWWSWFNLETKEEIMYKILGKEQKVFKEKKKKEKKVWKCVSLFMDSLYVTDFLERTCLWFGFLSRIRDMCCSFGHVKFAWRYWICYVKKTKTFIIEVVKWIGNNLLSHITFLWSMSSKNNDNRMKT